MASKIKLIFLGTSASIPTSKRNHTSILLNYNEENILIDCGEGTQRQFRKARLNPCKISKILISHWHGDHILGLPGLFQTLALSEFNKEIQIFGPKGTRDFMKNFISIFVPVFKFKAEVVEVIKKEIFFENEDFYLESCPMEHGIPTNAYNFVIKDKVRIDKEKLEKSKISEGKHLLKLKEGKDISFEGKKYFAKDFVYVEKGKKISIVLDTMQNKNMVEFVKDADLFICESSFDDDSSEIAHEHLHLTAGQAGEVAKKAGVKKLILTHISQRYENNLDVLIKDAKKNFKNVVVANDLDSFEL